LRSEIAGNLPKLGRLWRALLQTSHGHLDIKATCYCTQACNAGPCVGLVAPGVANTLQIRINLQLARFEVLTT
jgi:hypothetical protein